MIGFAVLSLLTGSFALQHSFDLSHYEGDTSVSSYKCLLQQGYVRPIFLVYESVGKINPYLNQMVTRAQQAGHTEFSYYIFPHVKADPAQTISASRAAIKTSVTAPGFRIWLDVEGAQYWLHDNTANCNYLTRLYQECVKTFGAAHCGIYANPVQWQAIFGGVNNCAKFSKAPLWWARYDYRDGADWAAKWQNFAGWTKNSVEIKQYNGDVSICGSSVDLDIRIKN